LKHKYDEPLSNLAFNSTGDPAAWSYNAHSPPDLSGGGSSGGGGISGGGGGGGSGSGGSGGGGGRSGSAANLQLAIFADQLMHESEAGEPPAPEPSGGDPDAAVNMDYTDADALFSFGQSSPWGT
jgi:hypothetical protein